MLRTLNRKQKIILINPPLYYTNGFPRVLDATVPHLGLLYLAEYINKNSEYWKASVIDIGAEEQTLEKTFESLLKVNPKVVGLTAMTPQLQGVLELAKKIKEIFPQIKIALGGPHISGDCDFINRFPNIFDFAICGEGEITLLKLLNKINKNEEVKGLYNGEIINNLNELPILGKKLVNRKKYAEHESIMMSRGCPFNCYYCSRPAVSRVVRYRSPESVVEEIKSINKSCRGVFHFQDDSFTINRLMVIGLCQKIIEAGLKIRWHCNTRIDLIDEELLEYMSKAGCALIHFGIESGNETIRKELIKKPFSNQDLEKTLKLCHKHKIKAAGYFMFGHPGETKETLNETENIILKSGFSLIGVSIPTPFPGSKLYEIAEAESQISKKKLDDFAEKKLGEGYAGNYPLYIPENFTKNELLAAQRRVLRKFYLRPSFVLGRIAEDLKSWKKFKKDFKDGISVILKGSSTRQPYREKEDQIVIISPFFSPNIGGLETHLDRLVDYLKQKNIPATVLTYRPLTTKINFYIKKEKRGSVVIRRLWLFGYNWFEKFTSCPTIEFLYIVPSLLWATIIYVIFNKKRIKCLHAHGLAAGFVARVAALVVPKRKILSTHYIYNLRTGSFFKKVLVWVFKDFDIIFTVGEESKNELTVAGLNANKIKGFNQWVDNKKMFIDKNNEYEIRKKLGLPEDKTIILFVGRLLEMKGILHLLQAAHKNKNYFFVFVGTGKMDNLLKKESEENANVIYVGRKIGKELVDYYNASSMVALPSLEEGSSLVVAEALSCGRPMIVTSRGSSKNMFPDELGEKIEPSADNLLAAIERIEKKLKDNYELRKKCRNFALKKFSDTNGAEIIKGYQYD